MSDTNPLISADELAARLAGGRDPAPDGPARRPLLLDVRWTLAGSDRDAYRRAHLPGAVFVDLDRELAGPPGAGGRHPLPEPADLQRVWRAAGISDGSTVVAYDGGNGLAAARAWWLLRWSGLRTVSVLDGGLPAWTADPARPVEVGDGRAPAPGSITVAPGGMPVVEVDDAADLATSGDGVLVDARAAERFRGEVEPVDPVAGHIPGSVNLPVTGLLGPDGRYRPAPEIAQEFAAIGITGSETSTAGPHRAAASCGSGVTACQLILAGELAGLHLALYPGSYSQWCALGRPVATGG
ncbi:sulfurtransferase [Nakamurella sp. GG22]